MRTDPTSAPDRGASGRATNARFAAAFALHAALPTYVMSVLAIVAFSRDGIAPDVFRSAALQGLRWSLAIDAAIGTAVYLMACVQDRASARNADPAEDSAARLALAVATMRRSANASSGPAAETCRAIADGRWDHHDVRVREAVADFAVVAPALAATSLTEVAATGLALVRDRLTELSGSARRHRDDDARTAVGYLSSKYGDKARDLHA